ncbi:hypothetical protein B0H17DRAFT_1274077 [Mycena rosella]|uniref:Uncharacterized protein n=1 Tax=Mycena rosella TaxID=1033263 RepID=A0AAD7GZF2_MYCRO|nr:hypothetical protein B0H17DRAFT_1274077 [Mycena rosella]
MRLLSFIYVSCTLIWAAFAAPIFENREEPSIRAPDVFEPLKLERTVLVGPTCYWSAALADIEAREPPGNSGNDGSAVRVLNLSLISTRISPASAEMQRGGWTHPNPGFVQG